MVTTQLGEMKVNVHAVQLTPPKRLIVRVRDRQGDKLSVWGRRVGVKVAHILKGWRLAGLFVRTTGRELIDMLVVTNGLPHLGDGHRFVAADAVHTTLTSGLNSMEN